MNIIVLWYASLSVYVQINKRPVFLLQKLLFGLILECVVFKECGMATLFVLVFPCFRENVVVTCKIGSFLCTLDNLLQKNVIVFFFGNQISKWRSFEKRGYF